MTLNNFVEREKFDYNSSNSLFLRCLSSKNSLHSLEKFSNFPRLLKSDGHFLHTQPGEVLCGWSVPTLFRECSAFSQGDASSLGGPRIG